MREDRKMWQQSPSGFNNWRRKNDLPNLINFFKESLPHFEEWQQAFSCTDDVLLKSNQTSEFFIGTERSAFYSYLNPWHWDKEPDIRSSTLDSFTKAKEWADTNNKKIKKGDKFEYELFTEFVPFFHWLKCEKGIEKFEAKSKHGTSASASDFIYNHWSGDPQRSISAEIFGKFDAVNLGQEQISGHLIRGKNLDFTNLDGLQIHGKRVASTTYSKIRYASCRELTLVDLDMAFIEFERCHFSDVNLINCKLQDLHIINTQGGFSRIYDSRLTHLIIDECCPIQFYTDISRANMPDFKFINHSKLKNEVKSNFYGKMRHAAKDFGYTHQAQENYFLERKYKMLFNTSLYNIPICRDLCDHEVFIKLKSYGFRLNKFIWYFIWRLKKELRAYKRKGVLIAHITARVKSLIEWMDHLVWGFGERPFHTIVCGLIDISFFACVYYYFYFKSNFLSALAHSTFVFTTIGYGNLISIPKLQYVVAFQALTGVVLLGLFLSSLVNKVRY